MFYSIKEAADKLGKSEDEIRQLVKAGRLREFRDGPNLLFKVDEVAALMSDTVAVGIEKEVEKPAEPQTEGQAEEILLAPETRDTGKTRRGNSVDRRRYTDSRGGNQGFR